MADFGYPFFLRFQAELLVDRAVECLMRFLEAETIIEVYYVADLS